MTEQSGRFGAILKKTKEKNTCSGAGMWQPGAFPKTI